MAAELKVQTDTISPHLRRTLSRMSSPRPVMEAIGLVLVATTKRAFKDASLRPSPWAPKRTGAPATLRKTGALWQSIRISNLQDRSVTVTSDRKYAAVHQYGSKKQGIPARPYFPFTSGNQITPAGRKRVDAAAQAKINSLLKK